MTKVWFLGCTVSIRGLRDGHKKACSHPALLTFSTLLLSWSIGNSRKHSLQMWVYEILQLPQWRWQLQQLKELQTLHSHYQYRCTWTGCSKRLCILAAAWDSRIADNNNNYCSSSTLEDTHMCSIQVESIDTFQGSFGKSNRAAEKNFHEYHTKTTSIKPQALGSWIHTYFFDPSKLSLRFPNF